MVLPVVVAGAIIADGLTAAATAAAVAGTALTAKEVFEREAAALYADRFPYESSLKDIKKDMPAYADLSEGQKSDRIAALKEYNAFVHAYVSARFVEVMKDRGMQESDALKATTVLGDARELSTRIANGRDWTEAEEYEMNRDRWNNAVGRDLGTQGLTNEEKADALHNEIIKHRFDMLSGPP